MIRCLEIANEMGEFADADGSRDFLNAQKSRLEQMLRSLQLQFAAILRKRFSSLVFEQFAQSRRRKTDRFRNFDRRDFSVEI